MKIVVQLHTLRNELAKDFFGTLKQVSDLGYDGVEFAGFYDIPAEKLKDILEQLNLEVVGSHTGLDLLEKAFEQVVNYNKIINNRNIVIPWVPMGTVTEFIESSERIRKTAGKLHQRGLRLHYHNHDQEFQLYQNKYFLDLLFDNVPDLLAEIDTHWVQRAGVDPVTYLKKHKDRTKLIHLKDLTANNEFAPLGKGIMDFKAIVKQAELNRTEALIVENDKPQGSGIDDVRTSIEYLKSEVKI